METALHRELKTLYAVPGARVEATVGRYRIDVQTPELLIEIQHASLAALRGKLTDLLADHDVLVVKPIVRLRQLCVYDRRGGRLVRRRQSPSRGEPLDLFDELVYLRNIFPHPRLSIEMLLVDVEEDRSPHTRRRRWFNRSKYQVDEQRLLEVGDAHRLSTPGDLRAFVEGFCRSARLPQRFDTKQLAQSLERPRWIAQKVAYCLRHMGVATALVRRKGGWLYEWCVSAAPTARRRRRSAA
ncbi:MAG: hypothetical protein K2Y37_15385 [Pirellulales bacterium]|nr:hypothetical protein [Pirellulales bacterium]